MSFSEGFASGFNMVDSAMQRRNTNDIMAQKVEQDKADAADNRKLKERELLNKERDTEGTNQYRRDSLSAQREHQSGALDVQKEEAGTHKTQVANAFTLGSEQNQIQNNQVLGTLGVQQEKNNIENKQVDGTLKNQAGILNVNRMNAETSRIGVNAASEENKADADMKKFALQKAQEDSEKQKDIDWMTSFASKGKDGIEIKVPDDKLEEFNNRSKKVWGTSMAEVATQLPERQSALATIQRAVTDPNQADKTKLLESMNLLDKDTINKGIGKFDGPKGSPLYGGVVERKEITDIIPHPADEYSKEPYYTGVITQYGTDAKGKPAQDSGPLTQFRSSNPNDKNVRMITTEDLVKHYSGHEALNQMMIDNPAFKGRFQDLYDKEHKVKGEKDMGVLTNVLPNPDGPSQLIVTDKLTGARINQDQHNESDAIVSKAKAILADPKAPKEVRARAQEALTHYGVK